MERVIVKKYHKQRNIKILLFYNSNKIESIWNDCLENTNYQSDHKLRSKLNRQKAMDNFWDRFKNYKKNSQKRLHSYIYSKLPTNNSVLSLSKLKE